MRVDISADRSPAPQTLVQHSFIRRLTAFFVRLFEQYTPDPYVLAVVLSILTGVLAAGFAPRGSIPTIFTGSANMSANSVFYNDENLLEITECPRLGQLYLAEFMRLFEHYRARLAFTLKKNDQKQPYKLTPDNSWSTDWYAVGSKANSRIAMAKKI